MTTTNEESIASQINRFGCSKDFLDQLIEDHAEDDQFMICASILSDAQEIMNSSPETSRQFINQAKYILLQLKDKFSPR